MAIGRIHLKPSGSATAPASLLLALPSPDAYRASKHGIFSAVNLDALYNAVMWGNGQNQLRHKVTNVLKTGILAPEAAPTATPTGARATATLNLDVTGGGASPYNPANNETIIIGFGLIYFVNALPNPMGAARYVVIGGSASVTLDNLQALVGGTTGRGVLWNEPTWVTPLSSFIEVTSKTAYTLAMRSKSFGSKWNYLVACLYSGTWTDCSLGSTGGTVGTIGYFENGADGSGSAPEAGAYDGYAYGYVRTEDEAASALSPKVSADLGIAMNVTVAGLVAPDDPDDDVDFIRIYRPIASGLEMKRCVDADEDAANDTDDQSNDDVEERGAFDESLYLPFAGGYPPRARCLAPYKGSVFAAGARLSYDYSQGTAAVTNGDNEVVLTGGYPTVEWIGRSFQVSGDSLSYPIVRVDASTKKLYLATDYEGTTAGTANYTVADKRNPYLVRYSEPLLPNSWQETYEVKGVNGRAPDGILQMLPAFGVQCVLTKTGLWTITGETGAYVPHHESEKAGVCSSQAAIVAEELLWWMSAAGDIYVWSGMGAPTNLSRPPIVEGRASGIEDTIRRLNKRQLEGVVCVHDPRERILKWYVPLDDDVTNRYVIVLDLNSRTLTVDECEDVTFAAHVEDAAGQGHMLTGDIHGNIKETGIGQSDGAYGFEPVVTLTAATTRTLTGTGFPTAGNGLAGVPVYLVNEDGDFVRAKIASNTATVLTLTSYITAPIVGTQIAVGGILWDHQSGRFNNGSLRDKTGIVTATVCFAPEARGQLWLASAVDQGTPELHGEDTEIDLSDTSGVAVVKPGQHGNLHVLRLVSVAPNFSPNLYSLQLEVNYER